MAALVVVALAAAGLFYLAHRNAASAADGGGLAFDLSGPSAQLGASSDSELVDLALQKLETNYYRPIDPQTPIAGERKALIGILQHAVPDATLPQETATGTQSDDAVLAEKLLADAKDRYAKRLGPSGDSELTQAALRGIMSSVKDPYTEYMSPHEAQSLEELLSGGDFGGIGVYIDEAKDGLITIYPIEGTPAARAGMKPQEVLDSVDGHAIKGVPLSSVEGLIRGPAGTKVLLDAHEPAHAGTPATAEHSYSIVRDVIHVPTVLAKKEGDIEYIRLADFGTTSADEVHRALLQGKTNGAKGYILDLRDNGGGLLRAAVDISSFIIPQGTIVSTIDRAGNRDVESANGDAIPNLGPIVVLVNKYTASASEITSGALQDYRAATIIGTKTFGKGVVQNVYRMPDQGSLKITTARYVTPLGRDIQHRGITPDVVIEQDPLIWPGSTNDKQLEAAKARLQHLIRS
jgi:carboxyl-terminal processing protease